MIDRRRFLGWAAAGAGTLPLGGALAMKAGEPSRTARGAALHRAAHQLLETPHVLDDPFALPILGAQSARWLEANLDQYRGPGARGMRAFIVMRSRFAEDELGRAVAAGVRQYVVLGAGLDTFGYRNPHAGLRVFEVDHPSTQAWKRARLAEQGIGVPQSLTFAPIDFETQTLAGGLEAAGFRADRPAFFSWLGVVVYLSESAVKGTLQYIAARPAGSQVVFDFAPPSEMITEAEKTSRATRSERVARAGEPWISYFDPMALAAQMKGGGYASAAVLGAGELNERYFGGRSDGFRLRGSGRMMSARV